MTYREKSTKEQVTQLITESTIKPNSIDFYYEKKSNSLKYINFSMIAAEAAFIQEDMILLNIGNTEYRCLVVGMTHDFGYYIVRTLVRSETTKEN